MINLKDDNGKYVYSFFFLRLIAVSGFTVFLYVIVIQFANFELLQRVLLIDKSITLPLVNLNLSGRHVLWLLLFCIGVVFWWKISKVFVFQGIPHLMGMYKTAGREFKNSGRPVIFTWIGSGSFHEIHPSPPKNNPISPENLEVEYYAVFFWFGSIFRYHQRSDSRFKTRLEFLLFTIPFTKFTVVVQNGTLSFEKLDHRARSQYFTEWGFIDYLQSRKM